jgi:type IV pilus assembly PilX-like protein
MKTSATSRLGREDGIALVVALMAMLLMSALGLALVLTTNTETMISGNFRNNSEALYAADAVVERAMDDLLTVPDWNKLLDGSARSAFIDGAPSGTRTLPDGTTIDIAQIVSMANCEKISGCTGNNMDAITTERPWGQNNPRWQLFAYGPVSSIVPTGTIDSPFYTVVLVGDDPSEADGDPTKDGGAPAGLYAGLGKNPGIGVVSLRAESFGPRGTHKVLELTVARTDTTELERGYTGQRGQDEQNRRARKSPVQTPGKALSQQTLGLASGGIL